jgi:hypothetical protein
MDNPAAVFPSTPPQPAVEQNIPSPAEPTNRWLLWLTGGLAVLVLGIAIGLASAKFLNH